MSTGRATVAVRSDEQLGRVVDELPRLVGMDVGQVTAFDFARLAAKPTVGLARLGVDAKGHDLLPVPHQPPRHVGAHPPQTNHCDLHVSIIRRDASVQS